MLCQRTKRNIASKVKPDLDIPVHKVLVSVLLFPQSTLTSLTAGVCRPHLTACPCGSSSRRAASRAPTTLAYTFHAVTF